MADYLDKLKAEYPGVFGPVAESDYTTLAGMGDEVDYILDYWKDKGKEGVKFLKDFAFEHMTTPEVKGYIDRSKERGVELEKGRDEFSEALRGYMERSEKDAIEKAKEYRDGKVKISGEFDEYDTTERPGDISKFLKDAVSEAEVRKAWEDWADYGLPTDGSSDTIVVDPTTGVDILYDGSIPILDMIGPGTSGSKMSAETFPDWLGDPHYYGTAAGKRDIAEAPGRGVPSRDVDWMKVLGTYRMLPSGYMGVPTVDDLATFERAAARKALPTLDERLDVPVPGIGDEKAASYKKSWDTVAEAFGEDVDAKAADPIGTALGLVKDVVDIGSAVSIGAGLGSVKKVLGDLYRGTMGKEKAAAALAEAGGPKLTPITVAGPGLKSEAKTLYDIGVTTGAIKVIPTAATTAAVRKLLGDVGSAKYKEVAKALEDTGTFLSPEQFAQQYITKVLGTPGVGAAAEAKVASLAHEAIRGVTSFLKTGSFKRLGPHGEVDFFKRSIPVPMRGLGPAGGAAIGTASVLGSSLLGEETDASTYVDPYPGMIDPTFAPDASIHYTDPLKHYDTEDVPGHLPLSLTTPFMTASEGMEHAAEFAPPEWEYTPVMPSPSDYSRPDMEPSAPVDDFSSMTIPSGIPSYMKKDISGVWHDTRRFGYMPPGYDWRTGRGAEDTAAEALLRLKEAEETKAIKAKARLASIPPGFIGGPEKTITYIDATGGPSTPFGGVGDIGGGGGTVTAPLTAGGFYVPITPHIPITAPSPVYVDPFPGMTDPTWAA